MSLLAVLPFGWVHAAQDPKSDALQLIEACISDIPKLFPEEQLPTASALAKTISALGLRPVELEDVDAFRDASYPLADDVMVRFMGAGIVGADRALPAVSESSFLQELLTRLSNRLRDDISYDLSKEPMVLDPMDIKSAFLPPKIPPLDTSDRFRRYWWEGEQGGLAITVSSFSIFSMVLSSMSSPTCGVVGLTDTDIQSLLMDRRFAFYESNFGAHTLHDGYIRGFFFAKGRLRIYKVATHYPDAEHAHRWYVAVARK